MDPALETQSRIVRVFISSTFKDMQEERDELVKRVFPQLRRLCEQRGVTWGEVDLRWGVTDEQRAEGKVLPICLEEIRRCRPYFIGLLGERYGWIPDDIPQELVEREPWLSENRDHSVTELEILHGVLNNPSMSPHTYFYFRNPAYINSLPAEKREAYYEEATEQDRETYDSKDVQPRVETRKQKLISLKERIRKSNLPLREDYPDPATLGEWVLQDFTALINHLYPEGEQPDPLRREAVEHEAFATNRSRVYIKRQKYYDFLDAHARSDSLPLVVLGESGSGKSALLANWAQGYRQAHPDELLLMHFIGASPHSADWAAMLRRIMGEIKQRFDIQGVIPEQLDTLREAFAIWLNKAAARGKMVFVLDALNQLEDRDGALDLVWLPHGIPANVRLVLSTLPGRPLEEIKRRGWPVLHLEPLEVEEREGLIKAYLAQYSKVLSLKHLEHIANAPQAANPLYLRVLLDELRLFGIHEQLDERIDYYLEASAPDDLHKKVLERCEQDYERERPELVRQAMSLLWAARRGLSEAELLELLGSKGMPLPGAEWSPLHLALEGSLLSRDGLINFTHDYMRQAVQDRYLSSEVEQTSIHLRLSDYFKSHELGRRKVDELPWQLAQAGAWKQLYELLTDLPFFDAIWKADEYEFKAYWVQIEANSSLRMVNGYHQVLTTPERFRVYVWNIALLMKHTGNPTQATALYDYLIATYRQSRDQIQLGAALGNQANILADRGELDAALALYKEEESLYYEVDNKTELQACIGNQALIFKEFGNLDKAIQLLKEQEHICRELGDKDGLLTCLGNQALILEDRGALDEALALHKEEERLCRELGDKDGLIRTFGNQANILYARGALDEAMALHTEEERLCRELGNKNGLARSLGNQAVIIRDRGNLDRAMELYKEEETLCRELGNKSGLQTCLSNQAIILASRGALEDAMLLYKQAEDICRIQGFTSGLQACLGNQALILDARGDVAGALVLLQEQERICRQLGDKDGLAISLGNQASIFQTSGDLDKAMALLIEGERICRELGNLHKLAIILGNQALNLYARGYRDDAMVLHKEKERICRELGYKAGLQSCLGNQAAIIADRGNLDEAMALFQEQENICRELGNKESLARSLVNQALILNLKTTNLQKTFALMDEAYRLAIDCGYASLAHQIEGVRAKILSNNVK